MNKIPVHQILISSHSDVTESMLPGRESIKKFFPNNEYQYMLWDNEKIESFLMQNFHPRVLMAYNSLLPKAFKADLARYCILYTYGGWYIDATMRVAGTPPNMTDYDMFLVRDFYAAKYTAPWQVANGLIYSIPNHPIMKKMIDRVVKNCKDQYYGPKSLSVSGPELFGKVIAEHGYNDKDTKYLIGNFTYNKQTNQKIFMCGLNEFVVAKKHEGGVTKLPGTNSYVELWEKKQVYGKYKL